MAIEGIAKLLRAQIRAFFVGVGFFAKCLWPIGYVTLRKTEPTKKSSNLAHAASFAIPSITYLFKILVFIPLICAAEQWPVPPDNISTPGVNASDQHIAIDANGNVIAVWIENGYVKSRSKPISGSWS